MSTSSSELSRQPPAADVALHACERAMPPDWEWTNWAGIESCHPQHYFEPSCIQDVCDVVKLASERASKIRVVGSGHSPSGIACTSDLMVSLDGMQRLLSVDRESRVVTVEGGTRIEKLNELLPTEYGLAFANLGSISEQSIAGLISTGSHGTGDSYGSISSMVVALQLVTSTGDIIECSKSKNRRLFNAARCAVGALGIITAVSIRCVAQHNLTETSRPMDLEEFLSYYDGVLKGSDHTKVLWYPHTGKCLVVESNTTSDPPTKDAESYFWGKVVGFHGLEGAYAVARYFPPAIRWINQLWRRVLHNGNSLPRSDRILNIDCLFKQYVNEWAVQRDKLASVITSLKKWIDENQNVHFPVEIRSTAKDDVWLSPSYGVDTVFIGIIMYRPYGLSVPYKKYFKAYEDIMTEHGGRPHWAKIFYCGPDYLRTVYPHFDEFVALAHQIDPSGMFWGSWHDSVFGRREKSRL